MGTLVRRKKTWRYSAPKVMEFSQLMIDILVYVSWKFEMYIFKIAQVISENVRIAFLYVLSIHCADKQHGKSHLHLCCLHMELKVFIWHSCFLLMYHVHSLIFHRLNNNNCIKCLWFFHTIWPQVFGQIRHGIKPRWDWSWKYRSRLIRTSLFVIPSVSSMAEPYSKVIGCQTVKVIKLYTQMHVTWPSEISRESNTISF